MAKILIVDDDLALCKTIVQWLSLEHHTVETVHSGKGALELLDAYSYQVVVLDWELPDLPGLDVIRRYRKSGGRTPVLMLTGRDEVDDKALGLDMGVDDYLTKPFEFKELSARLRALMRRPAQTTGSVLALRDIVLDPVGRTVLKNGQPVALKPIEFAFLEFLLRHPDEVFSAEKLLNGIWKSPAEASNNALYIVIKRLRQKLDSPGQPSIIRNVHGVGYGLQN